MSSSGGDEMRLLSGHTSPTGSAASAAPTKSTSRGSAFAAGDHAVDNSGKVSIKTSAGVTVATFKVSGTYTSSDFHVGKDASGHVLVTHAATAADAGIAEVGGGSGADLLGRYDLQFSIPIQETQNGVLTLDSLLPPVSSAGTDPGGFGFHNDRTIDGERAALSVGVGWNGPIGGHGPGSGS